jgi:hypothetical protein
MRIILVAMVCSTVLQIVPAQSQSMGGMDNSGMAGGKGSKRSAPQNTEQQKADQQKKKAIDDAFNTALKRIPDPQQKYDPWRNAR